MSDQPDKATCPKCKNVSTEFECLTGGHWWFWCDKCSDHIEVPTPQFIDRHYPPTLPSTSSAKQRITAERWRVS